MKLWSKQEEVLAAIHQHRRVAVKSGNGLGKGYCAAVSVLWKQGKRSLAPELETRYHQLVTSGGYRNGYNMGDGKSQENGSIDTQLAQFVSAVDSLQALPVSSTMPASGRNSVVECVLPKHKVVGSNPIARSKPLPNRQALATASKRITRRTTPNRGLTSPQPPAEMNPASASSAAPARRTSGGTSTGQAHREGPHHGGSRYPLPRLTDLV